MPHHATTGRTTQYNAIRHHTKPHHTIPENTIRHQEKRDVTQVDKVSKDRTDNPGMKFRAVRIHMATQGQAEDLMKGATGEKPYTVVPKVSYTVPQQQTNRGGRKITQSAAPRPTQGYLTKENHIRKAISSRHEETGKRPITLGTLGENEAAMVMEIEDMGGYNAAGGVKETKMLQHAINWGLQRMTEKTITDGARQPRRSFVGSFRATNIFLKINIPADGGPTIICGLQVDVVVTATSTIEAGGLDYMILGSQFEMPGSNQWGINDMGNVMAQLLPTVPGEEYAKTRYTLLNAHYPLPTTHYSLLTTHYPLLATHYSLLTTHYSLLTIHYSLLTTHYSLRTAYY